MTHMGLHSIKSTLTAINLTNIGGYQITHYPFNQKKLQYQVSSENATLHFSEDLQGCFDYLSSCIDANSFIDANV